MGPDFVKQTEWSHLVFLRNLKYLNRCGFLVPDCSHARYTV